MGIIRILFLKQSNFLQLDRCEYKVYIRTVNVNGLWLGSASELEITGRGSIPPGSTIDNKKPRFMAGFDCQEAG